MGGANVIPGVSGGTIAFISGIYETLINSIKAFDLQVIRLIFALKFQEASERVNLKFLVAVGTGVTVSIVSLSKVLEYLLIQHEVLTLSFFFGLILASVYLVGKQVTSWNLPNGVIFCLGCGIAVVICFLSPSGENRNIAYVFLCGIIAACSMILPGLSGSYILLIMGNYLLVLRAVSNLDLAILIPLLFGCGIGLLGFSHLLAFVFKRFHNETVSLLTGFVLGSLVIIWPWKETLYLKDEQGVNLTKKSGELIKGGYEWNLPTLDSPLILALILIFVGVIAVLGIEKLGEKRNPNT